MQPVAKAQTTELILIRHAPAINDGRLCGRTDCPADCSDEPAFDALRRVLDTPAPPRLIASPARRCQMTAAALWPDRRPALVEPLWEQDFGDWDGRTLDRVPDLGPLDGEALANHRPPGGESFADMCARVRAALMDLGAAHAGERLAIVAHAGTVRAALAWACGHVPGALAYDVAPLSHTCLALHPGGIGIRWVNRVAR